jgi:hypothetical protein
MVAVGVGHDLVHENDASLSWEGVVARKHVQTWGRFIEMTMFDCMVLFV